MQGLTLRIFHHQVDELGCVDRFVQLYHPVVVQSTQDSDLSDGLFLALRVLQLGPIVLLNGHFLATGLIDALFDHCVGPMPNLLAKVVHIQVITVRCGELLRVLAVSALGPNYIALSTLMLVSSVSPAKESKSIVTVCRFLVSVEVLSVLF